MAESTVLLAALGIVATCVGGLIWVIQYMFQHIMPMLKKIDVSIGKNTKATKSNDKYLRERNGRDNEFHKQVIKGLQALQEALGK